MKATKLNTEGSKLDDTRLQHFLELKERISALQAELRQLTDEIKHMGSHSTAHYVAIVKTITVERAPTKAVLLKEFGARVRSLFVAGSRTDVTVARKEG